MSDYDPEIDSEIREAKEAAEREEAAAEEERRRDEALRKLIRDELSRYGEQQRTEQTEQKPTADATADSTAKTETVAESGIGATDDDVDSGISERAAKRRLKAQRKARSKKAINEVVTGTILSDSRTRRIYPYLWAVGILLIIYLMSSFSVQRLYHRRQVLERDVQEYRTRSINMSSEARNVSSRSAVARRVAELNLGLEESTSPVSVIDTKEKKK